MTGPAASWDKLWNCSFIWSAVRTNECVLTIQMLFPFNNVWFNLVVFFP